MRLRRVTATVMALGVLNFAITGSGVPCTALVTTHHVGHSAGASDCAGAHEGTPRQNAPDRQHAPATSCCPAAHACSYAFADTLHRANHAAPGHAGLLAPTGAIGVPGPNLPPDPPPPRA